MVHSSPSPVVDHDGVFASLGRLAQLEVELGLAETRRVLVGAAIAAGVALTSAMAMVAALVVLVSAGVALLVGAPWQHLLIAGGGVGLLAAAALAWSVWRLKTLRRPRLTLQSLAENWRWLEAQTRSRLRLR
ncbi:MAG: phage holin family protein [Candidatus Rokuibacteriota bacterium]